MIRKPNYTPITDSVMTEVDRILDGQPPTPTVTNDILVGTHFRQYDQVLEDFASGDIEVEEYLRGKEDAEAGVLQYSETFQTFANLERRAKKETRWERPTLNHMLAHEKEHANIASSYGLDNEWGYYRGDGINPPALFVYQPNFSAVARREKWGRKKILQVIAHICSVSSMGRDDRRMKEISEYGLSRIALRQVSE
jgi:hypothetical protein